MDRSFVHLINDAGGGDDDGGGDSGSGGTTTTNTGKFPFRKSGYMQISILFYLFIERIRFRKRFND